MLTNVLSLQENLPNLEKHLESLRLKCVDHLKGEGFDDSNIRTENFLHMRYHGTDCALVSFLHRERIDEWQWIVPSCISFDFFQYYSALKLTYCDLICENYLRYTWARMIFFSYFLLSSKCYYVNTIHSESIVFGDLVPSAKTIYLFVHLLRMLKSPYFLIAFRYVLLKKHTTMPIKCQ